MIPSWPAHRFARPTFMPASTLLLAGLLLTAPAASQPFEVGPIVPVPGQGVTGMRIDGAPRLPRGRQIPNAEVFGDTVEERAYGRPYDNSFLRPRIPNVGRSSEDETPIELRAREGRSAVDPSTAGAYARGGAGAIGGSAITRGRSAGPQRPIVRGPSRAIIRRN